MITEEKATADKIVRSIPLDEIREALFNEYRRRLIRYKMVDEVMRKKYGISFNEFEASDIVKDRGFSWEIESDAMEWEHAVEGVRYVEGRLKDIEEL